jgi:ketosteroid isomerase-like protein
MPFESPYALASKFNTWINSADLEGLASLMTDDHAFIDSLGSVVSGKPTVLAAWSSFFRAFPDYRNEFERHREAGDVVAIQGRSLCSDPRLHGPALWRATVREGKIAQWQVFMDTAENRSALGL